MCPRLPDIGTGGSGHLQYLSDIWLDEYGYYVHANEGGVENKALKLFLDWLILESRVS